MEGKGRSENRLFPPLPPTNSLEHRPGSFQQSSLRFICRHLTASTQLSAQESQTLADDAASMLPERERTVFHTSGSSCSSLRFCS